MVYFTNMTFKGLKLTVFGILFVAQKSARYAVIRTSVNRDKTSQIVT